MGVSKILNPLSSKFSILASFRKLVYIGVSKIPNPLSYKFANLAGFLQTDMQRSIRNSILYFLNFR